MVTLTETNLYKKKKNIFNARYFADYMYLNQLKYLNLQSNLMEGEMF